MAKRKVMNWQRGTSGREPGAVSYTVKARKKSGTKAKTFRCSPGKGDEEHREVCAVAKELSDSVNELITEPSDETHKAAARKARKKRKSK
jgi:hypothetical protein